jgi:hypothetical protein
MTMNEDKTLSLPIDKLQISTRAKNCLISANCETTGDIIGLSYAKLKSINGVGRQVLHEISAALVKVGCDPLNPVDANAEMIKQAQARAMKVIEMHHSGLNFKQIGLDLGVSGPRIRQIYQKGIRTAMRNGTPLPEVHVYRPSQVTLNKAARKMFAVVTDLANASKRVPGGDPQWMVLINRATEAALTIVKEIKEEEGQ